MLDRRHRLTTSTGFSTATRGRRAGTRTLVVHMAPAAGDRDNGPDAGPQVGFVVSRAVGNAVHRNRVKRRLRHLMRDRVTRLPGSAVLVVRALPAAAGATYAVLGQDLDSGLQRLGVHADEVDAP